MRIGNMRRRVNWAIDPDNAERFASSRPDRANEPSTGSRSGVSAKVHGYLQFEFGAQPRCVAECLVQIRAELRHNSVATTKEWLIHDAQ